jgi:hypothetical protein
MKGIVLQDVGYNCLLIKHLDIDDRMGCRIEYQCLMPHSDSILGKLF